LTIEAEISLIVLQKVCHISQNPVKDENNRTENMSYMLPDGNVIEVRGDWRTPPNNRV